MSASTSSLRPIYLTAAIFAAILSLGTARLGAQAVAGTTGIRHAALSVFLEDFDQRGIDNGLGALLRVSVPVHPSLDLAIAGSHESVDTNDFKERHLAAFLTAHAEYYEMRPFVDVSIGNTWQSARVDGAKFSDDEAHFGLGGGLEAPVGDHTALQVRVSYQKYLSDGPDDYWLYSAGLHHWITERVGAFGSIAWRDSDSTLFQFGATLRF